MPMPKGYTATGKEAEYVDKEKTVLVNRLGIAQLKPLMVKEEEGLVDCYQRMVKTIRFDTPLSCKLIREIHHAIFGDIYNTMVKTKQKWGENQLAS